LKYLFFSLVFILFVCLSFSQGIKGQIEFSKTAGAKSPCAIRPFTYHFYVDIFHTKDKYSMKIYVEHHGYLDVGAYIDTIINENYAILKYPDSLTWLDATDTFRGWITGDLYNKAENRALVNQSEITITGNIIHSPKLKRIQVFDIAGRAVFDAVCKTAVIRESPGVYIARIGRVTKRMVVQ